MPTSPDDWASLQQGVQAMRRVGQEQQQRGLLGQATEMMGQPGGMDFQGMMGLANQAPDPAAFMSQMGTMFQMKSGMEQKQIMQKAGPVFSKVLADGRISPQEAQAAIKYLGVTPKEFLTLAQTFGQIQSMGQPEQVPYQKTTEFQTADAEGNPALTSRVFNPATGQFELTTTPLPEGTNFLSRIGETAEERQAREIDTARGKSEQTSEVGTANEIISNGIEAARSVAGLTQGVNLMQSIETGGFEGVQLWAKNKLGIESANEAELSYQLSKAVLKQLRPTFGAAFTAAEGDALKRIEASLGKSTKGNIRLLERALSIAKRSAAAGKLAAEKTKNKIAIDEIDWWSNYKYDQFDYQPAKITQPGQNQIFEFNADGSPK